MSKYYYLIASLPELTLEDNKLSYTIADFKEELYASLTTSDKKLIDLFYGQFDNRNVLKLLEDKEAMIDPRGNYSSEELLECISMVKESGEADSKLFPLYLSTFISDYLNIPELSEIGFSAESRLAELYYRYGMNSGNEFVSAWFELNLNVNNILTALTLRKYRLEVAPQIVGDTEVCEALRTSGARDFGLSNEPDYFERLTKISEMPELVEREKKLDALRWEWVEEKNFFNYFTVERLFAFLLQLEMIERWILLDKETGSQKFRDIIASLKNDVQIPEEFK